jgi:tetratricopeptide (TPR) repeat protein/tRNA A-37 threonylcarbamoyl transferase component Bud32
VAGVAQTSGAVPAVLPWLGHVTALRSWKQGGLGEVLLGRDEQLHRDVAFKRIRAERVADSEARRRFELEAEITAKLEHPGIVPIYGMVQGPDGQTCYVMRFIHGDTLKAAIQSFHRTRQPFDALPFRALLQKFITVCETMAFAHSKGIIHRDLKPENVMLGKYSETLVVDWGLAKPFGRTEVERSTGEASLTMPANQLGEETQMGSAAGTPSYMSPEQATGRWNIVGPASDIYSLGAILYEMLTGQPPVKGQDPYEIIAKVQRGEFPHPRQWRADVPRPLEAICLKAMALKSEERYATAKELAGDVEHWLADEAVSAYVEPWRVRAGRWSRKHKAVVATAAAALLTATIGLALGLFFVNAEKNRTELARQAERQAKLDAQSAAEAEKAAKLQTQRRLEQIDKGVVLLAGMLKDINPANEEQGGLNLYERLRVRAMVAADALDAESVGDPQAVARLQTILGGALRELGAFQKAVDLLEKARVTRERELGPQNRDTLATMNDLAVAYAAARRHPEAIALFEKIRDVFAQTLGADHPDTWRMLQNLAQTYASARQLPQAIRLFEQLRETQDGKPGIDEMDKLRLLNNLAGAYRLASKPEQAIPLYEQARDALVPKLGVDHVYTLSTLNGLAAAYRLAGKMSQAIELLERVRDRRIKKLGANHPSTLVTQNELAGAYQEVGRLEEAIALFKQTSDAQVEILPADHPDTLTTLGNLAHAYHAVRKYSQAIALYEQVRDAQVRKLGAEDPSTLSTLHGLANTYMDADKLPEAITLFEKIRDAFMRNPGADHQDTLLMLTNMGRAYQQAGRLTDALPVFEQAATGVEKRRFRDKGAEVIVAYAALGYEEAKQFDKAESWERKWLTVVKERSGAQSAAYAGTLALLGFNLLQQKKWTEAETILRDCLAIRAKQQPDEWTTWSTKSMLGEALLGQEKYAAAEPLLLAGYEGMKEREAKIPPQAKARLTQALERLVRLYDAWGKPDEAAKWKKVLAERQGGTQRQL